MELDRRISATFKDLPGGQVLGPTYDYTQRLLDFTLLAQGQTPPPSPPPAPGHGTHGAGCDVPASTPRAADLLDPTKVRLSPPHSAGRPSPRRPDPRAPAVPGQPGHPLAKPGACR